MNPAPYRDENTHSSVPEVLISVLGSSGYTSKLFYNDRLTIIE